VVSDEYKHEQTKQQSTKVFRERDKKYDSESEQLTKREIGMVCTFARHRQLLCCFEIWFYVVYARMALGLFFEKFMVLHEYTTGTITLVLTVREA